MTLDILFLAKNRLEFTRQSLAALEANTNWALVRRLLIWDDDCADGTGRYLAVQAAPAFRSRGVRALRYGRRPGFGAPAAIMNAVFRESDAADVFAKIDNDCIVPPGWLDAAAAVMEAYPDLELLGLEGPQSRMPHHTSLMMSPVVMTNSWSLTALHGKRIIPQAPEHTGPIIGGAYAPCPSVGGIFLGRTSAFTSRPPLKPHSVYGGFGEWQMHHHVRCGWIAPPIPLFLLDRLPMDPWLSLSKEYESKGWQRFWARYPEDSDLWKWWAPREC